MRDAYQWLYRPWRLATGHALADQPVFGDYLNNPHDTAPSDWLTDICLPLVASTAMAPAGAQRSFSATSMCA